MMRAAGPDRAAGPTPGPPHLSHGAIDMNTRTKWLTAGLIAAGRADGRRTGGLRPGTWWPGPGPPQNAPCGPTARAGRGRTARAGVGVHGEIQRLQPTLSEDALNKLGEEGWELCAVADRGTIIFKRPKGGAVAGFGGGFDRGPAGASSPGGRRAAGRGAPAQADGGRSGPGPAERPGEVHVFALKNANAADLVMLLKEVFARPRAGPPGEPQRNSVVVTADPRTNSVVVVASGETLEAIKALVERLDGPDGGPAFARSDGG